MSIHHPILRCEGGCLSATKRGQYLQSKATAEAGRAEGLNMDLLNYPDPLRPSKAGFLLLTAKASCILNLS